MRSLEIAGICVIAGWMLLTGSPAFASPKVKGKLREYVSPRGVKEACVVLDRMPGGVYSEADSQQESSLCAINLNAQSHAVCPKLFSTSPGTLIYDLSAGPYAGNPAGFERDVCPKGRAVEREAVGDPVSFKMSVNTAKTSATFSNASLIYYHFSRYFNASVHVPVSVFRSMDKDEHLRRVTTPGASLSATRKALAMNHAAWSALAGAEKQPASYQPTEELFTTGQDQVYGVMLHPKGMRYGVDVNGTRRSGYGEGQNRDFQQTAPFRALKSPKPLADAVESGVAPNRSRAQIVFWMRDLIDITLLDYIFSQQDRVGNIDYLLKWYWVQDGQVKHIPASGRTPPAEIASLAPQLLMRTELGDNDAGVRTTYANFTKRTKMLENLRHYSAETYDRLQALDRDLRADGPLLHYVRNTFGLSAKELAQVVKNTEDAAAILRTACREGRLRFDVEPDEFLRTGRVAEKRVKCE